MLKHVWIFLGIPSFQTKSYPLTIYRSHLNQSIMSSYFHKHCHEKSCLLPSMGQVLPTQHSLWRSHPSSLMIHPLWRILIMSFPSYSLSPSIYHELSTIAYLSIFHEACIHPLYGLSSYLSIYHEPSILCGPSLYRPI